MTTTSPPPPAQPATDPVGSWLGRRGVLFLLLQAAVIGVLISYLSGLERMGSAIFPVFVTFSILAGWVAYRKAFSTDSTEPVHRLHVYVLYALLPVAAFSLVQIPSLVGADLAYWAIWLELGTQFTESGVGAWSFLAGAVWSLLVGVGLVLGYYVLFQRHNLANAMLYFGLVFLASALYVLPLFSPVATGAAPVWYVTQAVAFLVLALTAWAMPRFWAWVARPVPGRSRVAVLAFAVLVVLAPFAVAAERTANWQLDRQDARDLAAFEQVRLEPNGPPVFLGVDGQTARYQVALQFGPRTYTTAVGAQRAIDAGPVRVEGQLAAAGTTVAWCTGYVAELASPNALRDPNEFATAARSLEHVDVALSCAGPASAARELCAASNLLTASWRANATLAGERATRTHEFSGENTAPLDTPTGAMC